MEQVADFNRASAVVPLFGRRAGGSIPLAERPHPEPVLQREGRPFALAQAILDHVHFGVAVVGSELRLLFANQAARRECLRHPRLGIENGRLVVEQTRGEGDFHRALEAARAGRWSLVRLEGDEGSTLLTLMPLSAMGMEMDSAVLVVFGVRSPDKGLALQFYARACGLTAAEERVLRSLSEGLSPREIASGQGVALSTVRTQIGSIRSKTGACSLTDLMRTLGCLPPIMPVAMGAC
jgi:DNA-binding CsgD family transcriptional regulator